VSTSAPATTCSLKASVLTRILFSISPSLLPSVSARASSRGLSQRADQWSCFHLVYLLQRVSHSATVRMSHALATSALAFLLASLSQTLPVFVFSFFRAYSISQCLSASSSGKLSSSVSNSVLASTVPYFSPSVLCLASNKVTASP